MTTAQMECFLTAARLLSFTAAAEQLYMTQPSLSRQIAALESELGIPLFVRGRNTVTLTPAGRALYERLDVLHADYLRILEEVRDVDAGRAGHVAIGLLEDQVMSDRIITALEETIRQDSRAQVDISRLDSAALFTALMDGSIDLAQMLIYDAPLTGMSTLPLGTDRVHLALAKTHRAADRPGCHMEELADILEDTPLVMAALETFPEPMQTALAKLPPVTTPSEFPSLKLVSSISVIPLYVTAGLGATLVNRGNLLSIDPKVNLLPVVDGPTMTDGIVWRTENSNPVVRRLIESFRTNG